MVEAQPGPSSVLLSSCLGRTFSLPDARLSVTSTTSLNHLSHPSEASPAFLHLNIREISFWKQEGWMGRGRANHKTMSSSNPEKEFRQRCKRRRRRRGVVSYANQRATCSWLWPSPTPSNPTPNRTNGSMCCCYTRLHDPPAIPIISGYFIISGCSHNSGLNGWCVLVHQLEQLRKKKR